jgi:hypothetical protein
MLPDTSHDDALAPPNAETQLRNLGWSGYLWNQVNPAELENTPPVRITQVHRNTLHIQGANLDMMIPSLHGVTVGDWLLFNREDARSSQLLDRKSLIKRRAPGHDRKEQLIAANLDTAFIVSSCNNDFRVARLERYGPRSRCDTGDCFDQDRLGQRCRVFRVTSQNHFRARSGGQLKRQKLLSAGRSGLMVRARTNCGLSRVFRRWQIHIGKHFGRQ